MKHNSARLTAAGALARDLLYRNGHRYYPECDSSAERPSSAASVSLIEPLDGGVRVYPNPANRLVTLERSGAVSELYIRFVHLGTGRVCLEVAMSPGEHSRAMDISALARGIYVIVIQGKEETGHIKLVISH